MNNLELWPEAPELAAISMLASSIDTVAELLNDLHPELALGAEGDPLVRVLMGRLDKCRAALQAYHQRRVEDVLRPQGSRLAAFDAEVNALWCAAVDAGLLDDDIF